MYQLEKLDQSFSVISDIEAREVLGGNAPAEEVGGGGLSFCNPTTTTTSSGSTPDKDIDDSWS